MMKKKLVTVAAMVAVGMTSAACGSESDGPSSSETLRVGVISSSTGFSASNFGDYEGIVEAWVKYTNDEGGINGYPVKVTFKDDGGDAATALRSAQELVKNENVQAIVDLSQADQAFAKYLSGEGVPVVGGLSFTGPMASDANFFPSGGQQAASLGYGLGALAKERGKSKFAVFFCSETPVCGDFAEPFSESLKNVVGDMSLVYSAKIAANAPNYTAQCVGAKNAGADALFIANNPEVTRRVIDDCVAQGMKLTVFVPGGAATRTVYEAKGVESIVVPQFNVPVVDKSTEGMKLLYKIVEDYDSSLLTKDTWGDASVWPFAGLQLFASAAKAQNLTPASKPADVKAGLYALKDETLGGIAPPLNYTEGKPTRINCWFEEEFVAGKATLPGGSAPQCVPADKIAGLYKAFGD